MVFLKWVLQIKNKSMPIKIKSEYFSSIQVIIFTQLLCIEEIQERKKSDTDWCFIRILCLQHGALATIVII